MSRNMLDPNDDNRSEHSSTGTPSSTQMDTFDFTVVPPDPLAFLMNAPGSDFSGDSSTEESYRGTSTPPSSHGSPSCSAALPAVQSKPMDMDTSAFSFLTQQAFDDGLEFPVEMGNDFSGMDYSIFNNPSMFTNGVDGPVSSQAPTQYIPGPVAFDKPPYLFNFSQAAAAVPAAHLRDQRKDNALLQPPERRFGDISPNSSNASSVSSPLLNPSPFVTGTSPAMTLPPSSSQESNGSQYFNNPALNDLTQRVRSLVGVTMALPASNAVSEQPKVPIPRLQRPVQVPPAAKRKQSSPASTTPTPSSAPTFTTTTPAPAPVRTKTAHTTIERRYRTNINARIQSLRAAVPALRVLEERAGNRIGNLNIKGDAVDVIDERGYVDGVKVARKGSKANVLGKAVEYINVLKRRELRLTREKEGLRTLICSLVGGPALLKEWETMWVEQFGGPETDEGQDAEQAEADDEIDDEDEDGEDVDGGDDGAASKKRKRSAVDNSGLKVRKESKVSSATSLPTSSTSNPAFSVIAPGQPEKRKRGRPRKLPLPSPAPNPTPPAVTDVNMTLEALYGTSLVDASMAEQLLQQQRQNQVAQYQPGQYLLATFAFFSFFNSPVSYYASTRAKHGDVHTHSGTVLDSAHGHAPNTGRWMSSRMTGDLGWRDVVQVVHIAVSLLLLLSVVGPWLPIALRRRCSRAMPRAFRPFLGLPYSPRVEVNSSKRSRSADSQRSTSDSSEEEKEDANARETLASALTYSGTDARQTARVLRNALGLGPGLFGMISSVIQVVFMRVPGLHRLERRVLEQRAFTRLAELVALDVTAPTTARLQTYLYASKFISASSASPSDLATLALVVQPLWATKASALWDMALAKIHRKPGHDLRTTKAYEALVLEDLTVEEASTRIRMARVNVLRPNLRPSSFSDEDSDREVSDSATGPLAVLAKQLVLEFIRVRAEAKFVQLVLDVDPEEAENPSEGFKANDKPSDTEDRSRRIVDAGKLLDKSTRGLVATFTRTCGCLSTPTSSVMFEDDEISDEEEIEDDDRSADEQEITSLLRSIELYQQLFPSLSVKGQGSDHPDIELSTSQPPRVQRPVTVSLAPMPSPPPSPSMHTIHLKSSTSPSYLSLRRRLASSAFDRSDLLEDARDYVVEALECGAMKGI